MSIALHFRRARAYSLSREKGGEEEMVVVVVVEAKSD
jgi:hypothetical protein